MKKTILLALAFLAGMLTINGAARRGNNNGNKVSGFNFLSALAVVFFVGIMTACGGGGGGSSATPTMPQNPPQVAPPTSIEIATVERQVREMNNQGVTRAELYEILLQNNLAQRDFFEQYLRDLGLIADPVVSLPENRNPMTLNLNAPEIGAIIVDGSPGRVNEASRYVLLLSVDRCRGFSSPIDCQQHQPLGESIPIPFLSVTVTVAMGQAAYVSTPVSLPDINLVSFHLNRDIIPYVNSNGATVSLSRRTEWYSIKTRVAFQTRPTIASPADLCSAAPSILYGSYGVNNRIGPFCPSRSRLSYSPDIRQVANAAIVGSFRRGVYIGESGFAFSGNYNGDNRMAGFSYDFGNFAMRTDYTRLPSKQDGEVWLDTYRLGILHPINDKAQFFAGVDNYNNAIFAIDAKDDTMHRLGFAVGDGYAVKYEYRLNL